MASKKKSSKKSPTARLPKGAVEATAFLEQLVGPLTFGGMLRSIRLGEDISLATFAKRLGISRTNLSDIELGRRGVSVERAAAWAKLLGYHEGQFVQLAFQAQLDEAGLKLKVDVSAA